MHFNNWIDFDIEFLIINQFNNFVAFLLPIVIFICSLKNIDFVCFFFWNSTYSNKHPIRNTVDWASVIMHIHHIFSIEKIDIIVCVIYTGRKENLLFYSLFFLGVIDTNFFATNLNINWICNHIISWFKCFFSSCSFLPF